MKEEKVFKEKVDDGVTILQEIDAVYKPEFGALKRLFSMAFPYKGIVLNKLINYKLYNGSYPEQDSVNYLLNTIEDFAVVFKLYSFLGLGDKIIDTLKVNYGITIADDVNYDDLLDQPNKMKKFEPLWADTMNQPIPDSKKEMLEMLLEKGISLKDSIVKDNREVKIKFAEEVETLCEIEKSKYNQTVGLSYRAIKSNSSLSDITDAIQANLDATVEICETLEKQS